MHSNAIAQENQFKNIALSDVGPFIRPLVQYENTIGNIAQLPGITSFDMCLKGQIVPLKVLAGLTSGCSSILLAVNKAGIVETRAGNTTSAIEPGSVIIADLSNQTTLKSDASALQCLILDLGEKPGGIFMSNEGLGKVEPSNPAAVVLAEYVISFAGQISSLHEEEAKKLIAPLLLLLQTAERMCPNSHAKTENPALTKIKAYIHDHLQDATLSIDEIAKNVGVSRAQLYRLAEPLGGVQKYIRSQRLSEAYRRLTNERENTISITALSYDVGFNTEASFRRAFKEQFGITPIEARQTKHH